VKFVPRRAVECTGSTMEDVVFETSRLRCRRWRADDAGALLAVYGDADAMRWVGDGQPLSREGCEEWLRVTASNYRTRGYGMFALEERATGEVAGFVGLVHPGGQAEVEVKYALQRSRWGRGLATEAVRALLAYGSEAHGIRRVIATVAPANAASRRVLARAGMHEIEHRHDEDGTDTLVYEWRIDDDPGRAAS
jgi:[ribosomal protein S5]-alanine N-acetyltransferase